MSEVQFQLAGAEISWPIGVGAGVSNHPDIEVVANRLDNLYRAGFGFVVGGSWTVGDERGGNAFIKTAEGWEYTGGDEYVDPLTKAGYNCKGLPGPGTNTGMSRLSDFVDLARTRNTEFALSFSPHGGEPLEELKEIYHLAKTALSTGVLFAEVNLSCPNVPGRPAFYLDEEGVGAYYDFLDDQPVLLNKHGRPGLWHKYGPLDARPKRTPSKGGIVTSNTLGNQEPKLADGSPAIEKNAGKAGMSGPALRELGRAQLALWSGLGDQRISMLGVDSGTEVKYRLDHGADAVEVTSIVYWPHELMDVDTPAQVAEKLKSEFVDAVSV